MATTSMNKSRTVTETETIVSSTNVSAETSRISVTDANISVHRKGLLEDKQELGVLNTQLAVLIGRVQTLQDRIRMLERQKTEIEEEGKAALDRQRHRYEIELNNARAELEKLNQDRNRMQLTVNEMTERAEEFRVKADELETTVGQLRADKDAAIEATEAAESQLGSARREIEDLKQRLAQMRQEREDWKNKYSAKKSELETEIMHRIEIQDKLTTKEEDYERLRVSKDDTIQDLEDRLSRAQYDRDELEQQFATKYNERLSVALLEARDRYEREADIFRTQLKEFYEMLPRETSSSSADTTEVVTLREQYADSLERVEKLQADIRGLEAEIKRLNDKIKVARYEHTESISQKDQIINKLNITISEKEKVYEELLDAKISLEAEIAEYRRLLTSADDGFFSPGRRAKRTRIETETGVTTSSHMLVDASDERFHVEVDVAEASPIAFNDILVDSKAIEIENTTGEDVAIGGFELRVMSRELENSFVFPSKATIPAHGMVRVFANRGGSEATENDHVWEGVGRFLSRSCHFVLVDTDGKNLTSMTVKENSSSLSMDVEPKHNESCLLM